MKTVFRRHRLNFIRRRIFFSIRIYKKIWGIKCFSFENGRTTAQFCYIVINSKVFNDFGTQYSFFTWDKYHNWNQRKTMSAPMCGSMWFFDCLCGHVFLPNPWDEICRKNKFNGRLSYTVANTLEISDMQFLGDQSIKMCFD
jgi:hypothetical protein